MKFIYIVMLTLLTAGCSDCEEGPPVSSSVTCYDVFDGRYKACYGPHWDEPVQKWCSAYDNYIIELNEVLDEESQRVIESKIVDYRAPLAFLGVHWSVILHHVDKEDEKVCFDVSEPPVCFELEH